MAGGEPPEKDMKDFEFIQLCKFRVSQTSYEFSPNRSQLVASSSLYGLLFFATNDKNPGFKVVKTTELLAIDQNTGKDRNKVTVTDFPVEAEVTLPSPVEFLSLSGDNLTLAVVLREVGQLNILYFDVRSLTNKPVDALAFTKSTFNTIAGVSVVDIGWNPMDGSMVAICLSDGSMQMLEIKSHTQVLASLQPAVGATCFSWSSSGKQLMVGKKDGSLTQYDPSFKEKKHWQSPTVFNSPHGVVDVVWVAAYSFFASYLRVGAQPSEQPVIILTQSNKENNTKYINFEDPCFSNSEDVKPHFLFHFMQKWDMVIMASCRASEATIIGKSLDDKVTWEHWNLDDCSRAELPLASSQNDSYPLGLAVDFSPQDKVVLSETKVLPPCPIMFILSNDGLLLSYHLSYTHKNAVQVTTTPKLIETANARKGVPGLQGKADANQAATLTPPVPSQAAALSIPTVQPTATTKTTSPFAGFSTAAAAKPTFAFGGANGSSSGGFFGSAQKLPPPFSSSPFQSNQSTVAAPISATPSFSFPVSGAAVNKGQSSAFVSLTATSTSAPTQQPQGVSGFTFGQSRMPQPQPKAAALSDSGVMTQTPTSVPLLPSAAMTGPKPDVSHAEGTANDHQPYQNLASGTTSFFGRPTQPLRAPAPAAAMVVPVSQLRSLPAAGSNSQAAFQGHASMGAPPAYASHHSEKGTPSQVRDPATSGTSPGVEESRSNIKATVDSAFIQNISEEIADFELEITSLKNRAKQGVKVVGNRDEMQILRQNTEKMSNFLSEIKEATKEQTKESNDLKSACYNLLFMAEECNTLHQRNNDPYYHSLLQGRALDPVSAEKLKSLQQMTQSIEATVVDVDHVLDSQWADHLNKEKGRMNKFTGDTIYKTIKNNNWLISDQRGRLEKLEEQIRSLKVLPKNRKFENGSPLDLLQQTTRRTSDAKASPTVKAAMTPEKVSRLKDYLLQRKVPVVKSTTPADLSLSRIVTQSAARKASSSTKVKMSTPQQDTNQQPRSHPATPLSRPSPGIVNQQIQQTPTGIPAAQLRLARGPLPDSSSLPIVQKPSIPFGAGHTHLSAGQATSDAGGFLQQKSPGISPHGPTAFSGMAYFKQQSPQLPPTAMGQGFFSGQTLPPEVQAAAQVLSKHIGGSISPGSPLAHIPQLLSAASAGGPGPDLKMQNIYEDITPTETDETNDDEEDDDYDEEDNGYEDEDEDEEDVVLRPRLGQEDYQANISTQSLGQGGSTSNTPKSLFGKALPLPQPGGVNSGSAVAGMSSLGGGDAKQEEKLPSIFAQPKLGGGVAPSFNFGGFNTTTTTSPASTVASATTTPPPLFGGNATSKPAFPLGGSVAFGRICIPATTAGGGSLFGSMATPSRSVGFSDLTSLPSESGTPAAETDASSSVQQMKTGLAASPTSTDNSSKDVVGVSCTSSNGEAMAAPATVTALPFGDTAKATSVSVPVSTSPITAFSFVGSTTDSTKSGGENMSLFGKPVKSSPKPDETVNTSPFASHQTCPSGFSIFGGNNVTATTGSKPVTGFDAVFSATTTPVVTSSTSGFSFAPGVTIASTGVGGDGTSLFGSQPVSDAGTPLVKPTDSVANASGESATNQTLHSSTSAAIPPDQTTATTTAGTAKEETSTATLSAEQKSLPDVSSTSSPTSPSVSSNTPPSATQVSSPTSPSVASAANATSTTASSGFTFRGFEVTTGSSYSSTSIFGTPVTAAAATTNSTSTTPSLFGNVSQTSATTVAGFGAVPASTSQATTLPVFGGLTGTNTSGGLFGSSSSTSATASTTSGVPAPLFGGAATTAPVSNAAATTTTSSLFSGSSFGTTSLFGTAASTGGSLFGGSDGGNPETKTTAASIFGGGMTTSASSVPTFGFGASSQPSGGLFGGMSSTSATTTSQGSGNLFSTTQSGGGGLFGNSSSTGSFFGSSSASTPSATTSQAGSLFGQSTSATNTMGFGQDQSASSSLFSSGVGGFGLGGKPSEEKANQNVFGSASQTFGNSSTEQKSLFGSGGSSTFGSVEMGASSFSGGAGGFSANTGGGVLSTGFGVSPSANTAGFGASPKFGSTATFGSPGFGAGFGSSAFGSSPAFGNGAAGTGTGFGAFGSAPPETAGFGNFASSSAPSFGQLAQSSPKTFGANNGGGGGGAFGANASMPTFGSGGGDSGGGGGSFGSFGASPGFGQAPAAPAFGSTQSPGFGGSSFGSSPAFSSYRG